MQIYFLPLACSLATRITLYELGVEATFIEVDPVTKRSADGADLHAVNPLGLVPTLVTDAGQAITENVAVLLHLAAGSALAPEDQRTRLLQWLGFIATELHKGTFNPLFSRGAPDAVRKYSLEKSSGPLGYLDAQLKDREFLLDDFSVADAYLLTVLNWAQATPIDLSAYPNVAAYLRRGRKRPSVASALELELPLYLAEQQRLAADN